MLKKKYKINLVVESEDKNVQQIANLLQKFVFGLNKRTNDDELIRLLTAGINNPSLLKTALKFV